MITSSKSNITSYSIMVLVIILFVLPEVILNILDTSQRYIVKPSETFLSGYEAIKDGFILDVLSTLFRTLLGFLIATVIGIVIGIILGTNELLTKLFEPLIHLLRPLPSSAIAPIVAVITGLALKSYIIVIVFGSMWPILINTMSGVSTVNKTAEKSIMQLKLNPIQKLRIFIMPEAAKEIYAGLQISLSISFILAITAELLIGVKGHGIGMYFSLADTSINYSLRYFCLFSMAFVGWVLNYTLSLLAVYHPWLNYDE